MNGMLARSSSVWEMLTREEDYQVPKGAVCRIDGARLVRCEEDSDPYGQMIDKIGIGKTRIGQWPHSSALFLKGPIGAIRVGRNALQRLDNFY